MQSTFVASIMQRKNNNKGKFGSDAPKQTRANSSKSSAPSSRFGKRTPAKKTSGNSRFNKSDSGDFGAEREFKKPVSRTKSFDSDRPKTRASKFDDKSSSSENRYKKPATERGRFAKSDDKPRFGADREKKSTYSRGAKSENTGTSFRKFDDKDKGGSRKYGKSLSEGKLRFAKRDDKPSRFDDSDSASENKYRKSTTGKFSKRDEKPASRSKFSRAADDDKKSNSDRPFTKATRTSKFDSKDSKPRTSKFDDKRESKGKDREVKNDKSKRTEKEDLSLGGELRLNRYLSNAGVASRREADDLIGAGLVSVNGKVVTEMGYKVEPNDDVRYNGQRLSIEQKVYLLLNKPKDAITTNDDPEGRNTVMDIFEGQMKERIYPVGRLDRNTTGVLLLTNDGELAQRLMHPKYEVKKVYKATLNKAFKKTDLFNLVNNGVDLEDGHIQPDGVAIPNPNDKTVVGIEIHSGRNRIIHRMFEAMGYVVDKLDRISYADITRSGLDRGHWRHLNDKELKGLKRKLKLS
jgi:23S rRNA pseudouridine2605 synthase